MLVDCGDIVVHIMQPAVRAYYNLEELWTPAVTTPRRATAGRVTPGAARGRPCMKLRVVALGHRMPAWVDAG